MLRTTSHGRLEARRVHHAGFAERRHPAPISARLAKQAGNATFTLTGLPSGLFPVSSSSRLNKSLDQPRQRLRLVVMHVVPRAGNMLDARKRAIRRQPRRASLRVARGVLGIE